MKKIMIYPGTFNPPHLHHIVGILYFGKEYDINEVIILPSYTPSKKESVKNFEKRREIFTSWKKELPLSQEMVEPWIKEAPYLSKRPGFKIVVHNNNEEYKNTGKRLLNTIDSIDPIDPEKMNDYYLLLGFDAFLKFDMFCDYKEILKRPNLNIIINNYDNEKLHILKDDKKTSIKGESGRIILPKTRNVIIDKNPASGLHSTDIRENPEKYLYIFPEKTRKLIEKYYMKGD